MEGEPPGKRLQQLANTNAEPWFALKRRKKISRHELKSKETYLRLEFGSSS
jgi:hypothetical protein